MKGRFLDDITHHPIGQKCPNQITCFSLQAKHKVHEINNDASLPQSQEIPMCLELTTDIVPCVSGDQVKVRSGCVDCLVNQ